MRCRRSPNRDDGAPTAPPARLRSLGVGRVDLALSRVKLPALDFPAVGGSSRVQLAGPIWPWALPPSGTLPSGEEKELWP